MKNEKALSALINEARAKGLDEAHINSVIDIAGKKGVATAIKLLALNIKVELEGALDNVVATETTETTEASRTTGLHGYFAM